MQILTTVKINENAAAAMATKIICNEYSAHRAFTNFRGDSIANFVAPVEVVVNCVVGKSELTSSPFLNAAIRCMLGCSSTACVLETY